jgi:hypothetical protein
MSHSSLHTSLKLSITIGTGASASTGVIDRGSDGRSDSADGVWGLEDIVMQKKKKKKTGTFLEETRPNK